MPDLCQLCGSELHPACLVCKPVIVYGAPSPAVLAVVEAWDRWLLMPVHIDIPYSMEAALDALTKEVRG